MTMHVITNKRGNMEDVWNEDLTEICNRYGHSIYGLISDMIDKGQVFEANYLLDKLLR